MALRITENAEIQTASDSEETSIQINLASSSTSNSQYYLSRASSSLSPGNEFVLWGWLQALRATGCLSKVSTELSADHIDLYRQVLSNMSTISACAIAKALKLARKIVAIAQKLSRNLMKFNVPRLCHWGKYSAIWNKPLTFYELILICTKYLAILAIYSISRHGGCLKIIIDEHVVLIGKPIIIIYIFLTLGLKFREIFLHKTMNPLKHWSV